MAKKGGQATRGSNGSRFPAWLLIGVGMLFGVVLTLVAFDRDWVPQLRKHNLPQPNPEAVAPRESEPPVAEASKKKNYDFYQVLPEAEVVIPDAELSAKAKAEQQARTAAANPPTQTAATTPAATTPTPTTPAAGAGRYILQVGSYPDSKVADEQKAKLAMAGYTSQVQPVTIDGKTWHRVRLGPYASASDLQAAKRALSDSGINAIALKETGAQ
ncbi:MAG: SPOR domain-containing protein [Rhodanobacter sp.]|jgi:cell division protein FtsN|nr:SPOR domain-containing protein [Rhodanobacter sp.]